MSAPNPMTRDEIGRWIRQEAPALAPAWLKDRRWFGGKARTIDRVDVGDVVWLPDAASAAALVVLHVAYADRHGAASERYAIVVRLDTEPQGAVFGRLTDERYLVEGATDASTLLALVAGLAREAAVRGTAGGEIVYADATESTRRLLSGGPGGPPAVRTLGAEQSNTSARIGSTHVFKLFRRLEPGSHPELEMGRFLTRAGFAATPPLEGSLTYRDPAGDAALGVLQRWVDNQGDGWSYVIGRLERAARDGGGSPGLARDLVGLGGVTADFHAAVASNPAVPDFAPEPVQVEDERAWRAQILEQAERTFTLVDQHRQSWNEPAASLAESALAARPAVARRLDSVGGDRGQPLVKIRIHGDFHLGQTLKTCDGFMIIDFEGEPSKPLAERRSKQCALRDVAGMLRSLDYAVAAASERLPGPARERLSSGPLREAFLDGYRSRAFLRNAQFLPFTEEGREAWLRLFELDKALYEVEYEVNNRPTWVHIPLRALCRLLA